MINQMQAVTGRKPTQRYVDIINASVGYLPSLYAAKEQREYQDEMLQLEQDRLDEESKWAKKNLALSEKQGKEANTLGMINLGLTGGLGLAKNKIAKDIPAFDSGGAISSGGSAIPSVTPGVEGGYTGFTEAIPETFTSKVGTALTKPSTYGYGGMGYMAGKLMGGDNKGKSAAWGAGIGAGLSFLSGGSITESVLSGILGGGSAWAF